MIVWKDDSQELCICQEVGVPRKFKDLYDVIGYLKCAGLSNNEICNTHVTDDDGIVVYNISLWTIMHYNNIQDDLLNYVEPETLIVGDKYKIRPSILLGDLKEKFGEAIALRINKHRYCEVIHIDTSGFGTCRFIEFGIELLMHKSMLVHVASR